MRNITILLIEDNSQDIRLIKEMLKEIRFFNYDLVSAATLKDGCEQIQKNNFDIILLDLNLPDSTGRQTFQKVIDCSKEIPVVLITGIEDEELSLKLIKQGAQDYLTKQNLNPNLLGKSILYSIERQALLRNIKIQNVQIDRIEKERILIAKLPSQNPAPILRVAGNGKLLYINEAGTKLLPDWQLIINETIPSRLKDILDPIFIEGTNIKFELCHREFIYSFTAVPLIEEGYINLYGRDITERKRTEEALRESETKLQAIFNTVGTGIIIIDRDTLIIIEANQTAIEMAGLPKERIIGQICHSLICPAQAGKCPVKDLGQSVDHSERKLIHADGHLKDILKTVYPIILKGRDCYVESFIDITELKLAEQELIFAKEKAEESDELKTAFLNNISHEIRTPFGGILGFLSILQDSDLTNSERDEYIDIINKSAYRLMNTINDIVEISQIQTGQMKLTASETNIKSLTGELFDHFVTDAESRGLKFSINNDLPDSMDCIFTDRIKLKTILSILIGNAIKFTKAGSVEFGYDMVETHCPRNIGAGSASLRFYVKDTGIGIPENKKQVIFERFMQADVSNTRQFEGSGLGLSISTTYAEMLGGKIWVESEEGKGSTFYFTIPVNTEPEERIVVENIVSADEAENKEP